MSLNRLILLLFMLSACKRDVPVFIQCDRTVNLGDCMVSALSTIDVTYTSPSVNPSNKDELVMVEDNRRLVKLNTATGTRTVLADDIGIILTPDWGAQGWIVFSAGWKIWKIREDGSGLNQLTYTPRDLYPRFNQLGTRILYSRNMEYSGYDIDHDPELRKDYKMIIMDIQGTSLDSFCRVHDNDPCYPFEVSAWSVNDKLTAEWGPNNDLSEYGIAIYDLNGRELKIPYKVREKNYKSYPFIHDIEWHPNNGLIYFQDMRGIKSLDPENGKVKVLKKSCSEEFYEEFTITPDGEHIIAVKGEASGDKKTCIITEERYLVKMKINGSGEERIEISE